MIKLFWNTHNQIKPKIDESNSIDAVNYKWGLYHKENSDKWIYEILNKIQFKIIENERNIENENVVIVVDSSVEKKIDFQKCINDKEIEDLVLNERIEAAKKYKIQSTPTVVINEKKFDKPLKYKNLKKAIEKLI